MNARLNIQGNYEIWLITFEKKREKIAFLITS